MLHNLLRNWPSFLKQTQWQVCSLLRCYTTRCILLEMCNEGTLFGLMDKLTTDTNIKTDKYNKLCWFHTYIALQNKSKNLLCLQEMFLLYTVLS
jgi:hypothetical protein